MRVKGLRQRGAGEARIWGEGGRGHNCSHAGGAEASINVRALAPGRYRFFDEYNEKVARGALVVK